MAKLLDMGADLTRGTIGKIMTGMSTAKFSTFQANPEQFIAEASRIIKEQKATTVIEHLTYDATSDNTTRIFSLRRRAALISRKPSGNCETTSANR